MLYTPVNHFNWSVDNHGTPILGGGGTTLTADAVAHTKGTDTALLTGIAQDCYGLSIVVHTGDTSGAIRRQMIDFLIDPAAGVGNAGSSWSALINNLYTNSPAISSTGPTGHAFYFPLYFPAGTAIGARTQDVVGGGTCKISVRLFGQPTRPELLKVGYKVQTLGATTASTSGVSVTPVSGSMGSYSATHGTLTNDAWWWQLGVGSADATMNNAVYRFDVAYDATTKYVCMRNVSYSVISNTEISSKEAYGECPPFHCAPAGTDVYTRSIASASPDSGFTTVVYAVS